LLAKREKEQLTGGQLGFVTISRDSDGDGILRNVAPEGAMKFVPLAENRLAGLIWKNVPGAVEISILGKVGQEKPS
jgi:hypothetical protein